MSEGKARKKVAVVTLQGKTNYGNRLQNYAVVKLYEMFGCEVVSLCRRSKPTMSRKVLDILRGTTHRCLPLEESKGDSERIAAFERFDSKLKFLSVSECDDGLSDSFDYFSVGSDQVWNLGRMSDNDNWYYLRFARPEQRIALAPSIGVSKLSASQMRRLAKGVSGFSHLSVREHRGAELIKASSGREAAVVCDPTMALSPQEWRKVADSRLTPEEPYVFEYLLGERGLAAKGVSDTVTRKGAIPIISLSDKARDCEPPAGPAEFISLVDSATHVVTDSFHAAVFAILFHTPLTIMNREGGAGMSSRLETLSKKMAIEKKVHYHPSFDIVCAGDYSYVNEAIRHEREILLGYMETCLND